MDNKVLINIIFVLTICIIAWIYYKRYITLKYKYKFIAFRDKIREKAMNGEIHMNGFEFDFLENISSNIIERINIVNIWSIILFNLLHKKNKKLIEINKKIEQHRKKNNVFEVLYSEYGQLVSRYLIRKHTITFIFVLISGIPFLGTYLLSLSLSVKIKNFIKSLSLSSSSGPIMNYN